MITFPARRPWPTAAPTPLDPGAIAYEVPGMTRRQAWAAREAARVVIDVWRDLDRDHGAWRAAAALDRVARSGRQLAYLRLLWQRAPRGLERLRQVALEDMATAGAPPNWMR